MMQGLHQEYDSDSLANSMTDPVLQQYVPMLQTCGPLWGLGVEFRV